VITCHEFFDLVQSLRDQLPDAGRLKSRSAYSAFCSRRRTLKRWKRSTQFVDLSDLLTSLDLALTQDEAVKMAERDSSSVSIALIDGIFKDTDAAISDFSDHL